MHKKLTYLSFLCLIWSLVILGGNANADVNGWCEYNVKATEQCACGGRKNSKDYEAICQKGQYCRREIVEDRSKTSLTQSGIKYGNKFIYLCVTSEENKSDTVSICPTGGRKAKSLCRCGNTLICQTGQSCIVDSSSKHICSGTSVAEQQAAAEIKKQEEEKAAERKKKEEEEEKAKAQAEANKKAMALPKCEAGRKTSTECRCSLGDAYSICSSGQFCTTRSNQSGAFPICTDSASLGSGQTEREMKEYYSNNKIEAQKVDQGVYDLIEQIKQDAGGSDNKDLSNADKRKLDRIQKKLEKLAEFTGEEGVDEFGKGGSADNKFKQLQKNLQKLVKSGAINPEDEQLLLRYGEQLFQQGAQNALNALDAVDGGNNYKNIGKEKEEIQKNMNEVAGLVNGACPLIEQLRAKYQSGCWSCLVVEKLTSAFMSAAEKAYSLAQKAGIIVLKIGALLWILMWGLRNVSSFTQIEPANILSELFKFLFKIMLAYIFIVSGLKMIGIYFINPIMGLGAKIAESYWEGEEISPYTEGYDWDYITKEDTKDLDKNVEEAKKEAEENDKNQTTPSTQADSAEEEAAMKKAKEAQKNFAKTAIPNFIIPPVFAGRLTSPAGCRFHPIKKTYTNHKGLDIAGNDGAKLVASGPGTISWKINRGDPTTGYGYYAIITHNSDWSSIYAHMPVYAYKMVPDGSKVVQGQVIGYVGNSGASTGPHLHFEIKHKGKQVDPLRLLNGEIKYITGSCSSEADINTFPAGFYSGMSVPSSPQTAWTAQKEGIIDLTEYATEGYTSPSMTATTISKIEYTGPTTIMSSAVMNSILGATEAIGNITAENMVLGDAVMCYSTLENGGAWKIRKMHITNLSMWLLGAFIFCTGLLLTIAFAFYLLDISFKIGFAVIAMPIVVGLWPFEITKDKFSACISIIAKSAALFAFLAMSTSFTVGMTNAVFNYETETNGAELAKKIDDGSTRGLAKLYAIFDSASKSEVGIQTNDAGEFEDNIKYASDKLSWFSTTFVLLLFAFLYSYKLVQKTGPDLVNKFFPDKVFGDSQPMHHLATAAAKWMKDTAMKPIGLARDIAIYQGTKQARYKASEMVANAKNKARGINTTFAPNKKGKK